MILKSIKYSQFENTPKAWHVKKFNVGKKNLLVGKNASGKTRILNIINAFAALVSGDQKLIYNSGNYEIEFENGKQIVKYILKYKNSKVLKEEFIVDKKKFLERKGNGKGKIFAVQLKKSIDFQVSNNELACVVRKDLIQHPFFNDLYKWGKQTLYYPFGSQMGKDQVSGINQNKNIEKINLKNINRLIDIFDAGQKKYGQKFVNVIRKDMKKINYQLENIFLETIPIISDFGMKIEAKGLSVKEKDLEGITNQQDISQGMFRALSLVIQLNYSHLESTPTCILIDDIGEGLDFERSQALIKLLMKKIDDSPAQLIMTTNDRFVMNDIPIELWLIINRVGGKCSILNYENSKKLFDEFKYTGLNNFDFFTNNFYLRDENIK
ncbi:MAG: AAA family ATPase [Candidatus Kerfeldbacteria bacterium]